MSSRRSSLLRHGALLVLPFALAACSSSAGTSGSAGTADAPAKAASSPADPDASMLKGSRLKTLLLPLSVLPKSYRVDQRVTYDSGNFLDDSSTSPVDLAGACTKLEQTGWIETSGVNEPASARADFMKPNQDEFYEQISEFRGTDAQTVMTRLATVFAHCAHFKDTSSGSSASVVLKTTKVPGAGDETLKAVMSAPEWQGGSTLVATRVGNMVITTFYNLVQSTNLGTVALDLTEKIAANVKAAHAASGS